MVVEALQCVKYAIRCDLLFREPVPSSILKVSDGGDEGQRGTQEQAEEGPEIEDAA